MRTPIARHEPCHAVVLRGFGRRPSAAAACRPDGAAPCCASKVFHPRSPIAATSSSKLARRFGDTPSLARARRLAARSGLPCAMSHPLAPTSGSHRLAPVGAAMPRVRASRRDRCASSMRAGSMTGPAASSGSTCRRATMAARRSFARRSREGHATLIRAAEQYAPPSPCFQPQAPALAALVRRVKTAFDPIGIFNPGRM